MMQIKDDLFLPVSRRKFGLLPIIDRYMLQEFLVPFSVLILGFMILFVIGDIYDDIKDFLEAKTATSLMFEYFLLKLPGHIEFILPISILLSCMYTMANLGKNLEIIAMRASGISLHRACASIYLVALLVTLVDFWFKETIVPVSEKRAYIILKTASRGKFFKENIKEMLTYRTPDGIKTWFFKCFDLKGIQEDVILKKYNSKDGSLEWDLEAEEAEFIPEKGWEFRKGSVTKYSEDGFMPGKPEPFVSLKKDINEFAETPNDIMNAVRPPEELPSLVIIDILAKTKNMAKSCKSLYETTLYNRLAFPWACVIAVFLGIPLAAKNERSGIFMSIIIAVAIILVYTLSSQISLILGNRGFIPPYIAGLGPTLLFLMYGWHTVISSN